MRCDYKYLTNASAEKYVDGARPSEIAPLDRRAQDHRDDFNTPDLFLYIVMNSLKYRTQSLRIELFANSMPFDTVLKLEMKTQAKRSYYSKVLIVIHHRYTIMTALLGRRMRAGAIGR
jgi:hypothetical protein